MSWQEEMVEEIETAKNGQKGRIMARYGKMTGLSIAQLYRIAAEHGYVSGRKQRSDKGECMLNQKQIKYVAGLLYTTGRKNKDVIMSVKVALDIAEQENIIEPGSVSVSRMQELLREKGLNKAALKNKRTHQPMRSKHPNHVHFMDVSVCIQYYLKGKKKELGIKRKDLFYKNRPDEFVIKQKIYRYVLTDHFSHTVFLKYYIAEGETSRNLWDFLVSAWEIKSNANKYPFRGVPFYLMMDKGAANTSGSIKKFIKKLDVKFLEGTPGNPRRQGSVECAQGFVENNFESRLRLNPVWGIDQLNDYALDWCAFVNGHRLHTHTRFGTPRIDCWLRIREDQLRECPDRKLLQALYSGEATPRKVYPDLSIRFKGRKYRIKHIEGLVPNVSRVKAFEMPFSSPEIMVEFEGKEYQVKPLEQADGGFDADAAVIGEEFKSMPETLTEKGIKDINNLAYGENPKKDAIPFIGTQVLGGQADRVERDFMPRQSTPLHIAGEDMGARRIPMIDLFKDLNRVGGAMTPGLNRAIRAKYGDSISLMDRDALVEAMEDGLLYAEDGELKFGGGDDTLKAAAH